MLVVRLIYIILIGIYGLLTLRGCKTQYEKGVITFLFILALNTIGDWI